MFRLQGEIETLLERAALHVWKRKNSPRSMTWRAATHGTERQNDEGSGACFVDNRL